MPTVTSARDTEGDGDAGFGELGGAADSIAESGTVGDVVVGGHDDEDGIFTVAHGPEGGQGKGRGGVAAEGFKQD